MAGSPPSPGYFGCLLDPFPFSFSVHTLDGTSQGTREVYLFPGFKIRISLGRLTLIRLISPMRQQLDAKEQLNGDFTGRANGVKYKPTIFQSIFNSKQS
ncbi:hypothetical protein BDW75DRAFT_222380 [Aspergillus navahoensis]